ncbi:MAG: hypothetical protein RRB22_15070 [Gammaproteobacteria bacterium]|nr:hypothetical protein [Gammaproteobacteria bacterium]
MAKKTGSGSAAFVQPLQQYGEQRHDAEQQQRGADALTLAGYHLGTEVGEQEAGGDDAREGGEAEVGSLGSGHWGHCLTLQVIGVMVIGVIGHWGHCLTLHRFIAFRWVIGVIGVIWVIWVIA